MLSRKGLVLGQGAAACLIRRRARLHLDYHSRAPPTMAAAAAAERSAGPATPFQSPTFEKDVTIDVNEVYTAASISPSGRDVVLAGYGALCVFLR